MLSHAFSQSQKGTYSPFSYPVEDAANKEWYEGLQT